MTATDRAHPRSRAAVTAAWLLAAAATVAGPLAVVVAATAEPPFTSELLSSPEAVVGPSFTIVGALLVGLPAARRIGWLMVTIGVTSATYALSFALAARSLELDGDLLLDAPADGTVEGALAVAVWLSTWAWLPSFLLVTVVLPQVVPYGRPLPARPWRGLLAGSLVLAGATTALVALLPGPTDNFPAVDNPLGVAGLDSIGAGVGVAVNVTFLLMVLAGLASLVLRVKRAGSVERRQLGWIGLGIVAALIAIALAPSWLVLVAVLCVPAGIALSAYRYRLYDVDLLVNRALVAGLLLGGAALAYLALVGWIGALVETTGDTVSFAAAFGVALLFHPARIAVQGGVDRLLYGQRGNPTALLAQLDDVVRTASSPRTALQAGVETVAAALKLPYVAVDVPARSGDVGRLSAGSAGSAAADRELLAVGLELHGERVGTLLASPRSGTDRLGRADQRTLAAVTGPLASAAFALRLSGDLEESRGRLVSAREEERRRLRRDLHDGLGPQMSGVVMGLDTALAALRRGDDARATDLVAAATGQAQEAVQDVRRLVHGLRPPALDDLGLVGALEALGRRLGEGRPGDHRDLRGPGGRPAGGRRGRCLPDRPGVADQRGASLGRRQRGALADCRARLRRPRRPRRRFRPARGPGGWCGARVHAGAGGRGRRLGGDRREPAARDEGDRTAAVGSGTGDRVARAADVVVTGWARVVVADDHPVFRQGLRVLLEDIGVDVVGEAADGEQAVELARETRPDVVLMDLQMPVLGGVAATRRLSSELPDVHVLVLTMVDDDAGVYAAIQAGALGYLLKGAGQEEIGRALRGVVAGEAVYGPAVARRVRAFFSAGPGATAPAKPFPALSDREREVLDLMAAGHANPVIARRLFLSDKTVRNYVTSIFLKLDVPDRPAAIVAAREAGLGRVD